MVGLFTTLVSLQSSLLLLLLFLDLGIADIINPSVRPDVPQSRNPIETPDEQLGNIGGPEDEAKGLPKDCLNSV